MNPGVGMQWKTIDSGNVYFYWFGGFRDHRYLGYSIDWLQAYGGCPKCSIEIIVVWHSKFACGTVTPWITGRLLAQQAGDGDIRNPILTPALCSLFKTFAIEI